MKVLLTGATGLLGSHILDQGLHDGHSFRLLVRDIPKRSYLNEVLSHPNVEIVKLDFKKLLENPEDFHHLFSGIDVFINAMGYASPLHSDAELMNEVNFMIPRALLKIAKHFNISFVVSISSVATMSSGEGDKPIAEDSLGNFRQSPYAESKLKLDSWIDKEFSYPTLSIHPCYMLGKWDARPSSGAIFFGLKLKKLKYFINNHKNFVAASDVAKALWSGVNKRENGHFLIGGVNLPIEEFIKIASKKLNMTTDEIIFLKMEDWKNQSKKFETIVQQQVEEFSLSNAIDDTKARSKLDHRPNQNIEAIIDETLHYFIQKKLMRL